MKHHRAPARQNNKWTLGYQFPFTYGRGSISFHYNPQSDFLGVPQTISMTV